MTVPAHSLKPHLLERKARLETVIPTLRQPAEALRLLHEVDGALKRMDSGWYGICENCHNSIEEDRLLVDPLVRVCLDCITEAQQRSLEDDLELAARIQAGLLPRNHFACCGYEVSYHYQPAGPVSGDYCDVVQTGSTGNSLLFMLGDVAGKGLAASLLVSHLHAAFHALVGFDLPVEKLMARANRVLCESAQSTHYATLTCGLSHSDGTVHLCNAGHLSTLHVRPSGITQHFATGVPLGLFCDSRYEVTHLKLESGDSLLLYSDGITETRREDEEFGTERIVEVARAYSKRGGADLLAAILHEVVEFAGGTAQQDDMTMLCITRK